MADTADENCQSTVKPPCKYGEACYQSNPEHLAQYSHPSPNTIDDKAEEDLLEEDGPPQNSLEIFTGASPEWVCTEWVSELDNATVTSNSDSDAGPSLMRQNIPCSTLLANYHADIKDNFLVRMPPDFFDLWEFCEAINNGRLKDPSEAFAGLGLHLVGPYDVLSRKISKNYYKGDNILCHYRFYYDPPEFQTVIVRDGDDWYHIGYFRDDPSEMPFGLASNCAAVGPKLKLVGDNIFAALNFELIAALKKAKKKMKDKFTNIHKDLKDFAENKQYSLDRHTEKTDARYENVTAKTFHELGIVVPYHKTRQIGDRALGVTNATLKSILRKIVNCRTEEERLCARSGLDRILARVKFANEEFDCGMGLELGIDLFCYGDPYLHEDILKVLKLAYILLDRPEFSKIIEAHLSQRIKSNKVSLLDNPYQRIIGYLKTFAWILPLFIFFNQIFDVFNSITIEIDMHF